MTEINRLNSVDAADDGDLIPLYSLKNGSVRKITYYNFLRRLSAYVAAIIAPVVNVTDSATVINAESFDKNTYFYVRNMTGSAYNLILPSVVGLTKGTSIFFVGENTEGNIVSGESPVYWTCPEAYFPAGSPDDQIAGGKCPPGTYSEISAAHFQGFTEVFFDGLILRFITHGSRQLGMDAIGNSGLTTLRQVTALITAAITGLLAATKTISGAWTFSTSPIVPGGAAGNQAINFTQAASLVAGGSVNPASYVDVTTAQTIGGVKTFSSSPQIPVGVNSTDAVRLSQVCDLTNTQTVAGTKTFSTRPIVGTAADTTSDTASASTAFVQNAVSYLLAHVATISAVWTLNLALFKGYTENSVVANTSTAYTVDITDKTLFYLTLTGNCTLTLPSPAVGKSFTIFLYQDATGSRSLTYSGSIKYPSSTAPTITPTASKMDKFVYTSDASYWYLSNAGQNY